MLITSKVLTRTGLPPATIINITSKVLTRRPALHEVSADLSCSSCPRPTAPTWSSPSQTAPTPSGCSHGPWTWSFLCVLQSLNIIIINTINFESWSNLNLTAPSPYGSLRVPSDIHQNDLQLVSTIIPSPPHPFSLSLYLSFSLPIAPYLIFVIFLHMQNFWRMKFTPKFTQ